ncbi:MAG: hypothetical protein RLZZ517_613 [Candidatus Parcubacteria bacterium]|jgi:hypothetical protein
MDEDLTKLHEEELLKIIRLNENSHVSTSRYNRAVKELQLRDREKNVDKKAGLGLFLRVGGDMLFNGSIQGPENGMVDIAVAGNYRSEKGKIIQGKEISNKWWEKSWFQILALLGSLAGLIGLIYLFK